MTSKRKWRAAQEPFDQGIPNAPNYRDMIHRSIEPCLNELKERFSQMSYKGEQLSISLQEGY